MKITDVTAQKNNSLRVNVFVDGKYRFSMDMAEAALRGIKPGYELRKEELDELIGCGDHSKARDYALSVLSRKPVTAKLLADKLTKKGYDEECADSVIGELTELGYIDDRAYGELFLEYCLEKTWGRRKIRYEMQNKGLDDSIIDELLSGLDEDNELESICELIRTKYRGEDLTEAKVKSKIMRYFASRGFEFSKIDIAIRRLKEE